MEFFDLSYGIFRLKSISAWFRELQKRYDSFRRQGNIPQVLHDQRLQLTGFLVYGARDKTAGIFIPD